MAQGRKLCYVHEDDMIHHLPKVSPERSVLKFKLHSEYFPHCLENKMQLKMALAEHASGPLQPDRFECLHQAYVVRHVPVIIVLRMKTAKPPTGVQSGLQSCSEVP